MKVYDAQTTSEKVFTLAGNRGWSDAKLARILDELIGSREINMNFHTFPSL